MKPSEQQLSDWVRGNLTGSALSQVEKWADDFPDEAVMCVEALEDLETLEERPLKGALPSSVEPPYADFFNAKLAKEIKALGSSHAARVEKGSMPSRISAISRRWLWFAAPSALAIMALCFLLGMNFRTLGAQQENLVYVPSERVKVTQMYTEEASMIVLDGLEPLGDDLLEPVSEHKSESEFKTISIQRPEQYYF